MPVDPAPLPAEQLYRRTQLSGLAFQTTADLEPIGIVGQDRAVGAITFATRICQPGFNLFVIGPHGARMQRAVAGLLEQAAPEKLKLSDWVYVNNFIDARYEAQAGSDASDAAFVADWRDKILAFDHSRIVDDARLLLK